MNIFEVKSDRLKLRLMDVINENGIELKPCSYEL